MLTPCIGVCTLNADNICLGCRRTLQEIADWTQLSDAQRQHIMQRLRTDAETDTKCTDSDCNELSRKRSPGNRE